MATGRGAGAGAGAAAGATAGAGTGAGAGATPAEQACSTSARRRATGSAISRGRESMRAA